MGCSDCMGNTRATDYWHWFFLIQPSPQVEEFILTDLKRYWGMLSSRGFHIGVTWSNEDVAMYQEGYFTKEGIHAVCPYFLLHAISTLSSNYILCQSVEVGADIRIFYWFSWCIFNFYPTWDGDADVFLETVWEFVHLQLEFTATPFIVGFGLWSHDIGVIFVVLR